VKLLPAKEVLRLGCKQKLDLLIRKLCSDLHQLIPWLFAVMANVFVHNGYSMVVPALNVPMLKAYGLVFHSLYCSCYSTDLLQLKVLRAWGVNKVGSVESVNFAPDLHRLIP
jgi:hypothetical protein